MKTFLKFLVFAALNSICLMNASQAHADGAGPKLNGLLLRSFGNLFSHTLIWPKTNEEHADFSYDHGIALITIDEKYVDAIGKFVLSQRGKWSACDYSEGWPDGNVIEVRWFLAKEEGDNCISTNEAIPLLEELSRISFSSGNQEFSSLMNKTRDTLKQTQK